MARVEDWRYYLERWRSGGFLDTATAQRISEFETREASSSRLEWPVLLALILGGIALGAGILLFVAANWDRLPPGTRFTLVVFFVAIFHFAGAVSSRDSPAFQSSLHALGTITLGAGIALTAQIFQLPNDWPAGTLLWALGACTAWALLRDTAQLAISAVLLPVWLGAVFMNRWPGDWHELYNGMLLLAVVYLGAVSNTVQSNWRMALVWIGGLSLLPLTIAASVAPLHQGGLVRQLLSLALPLIVAWFLRRQEVWIPALFAFWILVLREFNSHNSFLVHLWCAIGSVGLIAWGWREGRKERINLGIAGFALSVLFFYISNVIDKLGRSASLMTLGVLLLAGGWALERARRKLVASI